MFMNGFEFERQNQQSSTKQTFCWFQPPVSLTCWFLLKTTCTFSLQNQQVFLSKFVANFPSVIRSRRRVVRHWHLCVTTVIGRRTIAHIPKMTRRIRTHGDRQSELTCSRCWIRPLLMTIYGVLCLCVRWWSAGISTSFWINLDSPCTVSRLRRWLKDWCE